MKDIIELAREANSKGDIDANWLIYYQAEFLTRFAAPVRAAALEEAAEVVLEFDAPNPGYQAAAIRALKVKT